ncbi:MAG: hypothetical protein EOM19_01450 [Candidatus Moranbacteria bacterium]|nr:hypothetical protein [Candidatus Moranbacteria bacterium]
MEKMIVALVALVLVSPVMSAEITSFCPKTAKAVVEIDGNLVLKVWGVPIPNAPGKPLMAVPNNTWPRFVAVVAWRDAFLDAKEKGTCMKIFYDPAPFTDSNSGQLGYRIWGLAQ